MITLSDLDLTKLSTEEIGELLIDAKKAYYVDSKPIMDDSTFDTLEEILRQKSPHHRLFSKVGTQDFITGFEKKKHAMHMGSQNKVNTLEDLTHYFELKKIDKDTLFVVQPKCDGISLEIEYKNGKLVDAITRGDGEIGDVITQNVVKMQNFPKSLDSDFTGSIRCEIVVTAHDFQKINNLVIDSYSNSRNAASGISQRLDSKYSEFCSLFATDIHSTSHIFSTELEKTKFLTQINYTPVDSFPCNTFNEIEQIYQKFLNKDRQSYPFEIDGLVVKIDNLKIQEELGVKNKRPKGQVAYKFPSLSDHTQILSIDWQVGPLGNITPVAKVSPIELSGAIINFASLANHQLVKEKNINIGDIIEISRRGDVIPHIERVVTKVNEGYIQHPTICPSCGSTLIIESKFLKCANSSNCRAQILGGLKLFCDVLEIKGISEKTIEKLYDAKKIKLPGDFYKLTISDFNNLEGLGDKSGNNIIKEIQNKRNLSVKQIFNAASIQNFSAARIQQLISSGFDTSKKLLNITISDIEPLPGIQITLAQKIINGIQSKKEIIRSIIDSVSIKNIDTNQLSTLANQTFCITGSLSRPRKEIVELIENNGGKIMSGVSQNLTYLITNETESNSSKFIDAKKYNIPIISEEDLYKIVTPKIEEKNILQNSLF